MLGLEAAFIFSMGMLILPVLGLLVVFLVVVFFAVVELIQGVDKHIEREIMEGKS